MSEDIILRVYTDNMCRFRIFASDADNIDLGIIATGKSIEIHNLAELIKAKQTVDAMKISLDRVNAKYKEVSNDEA